MQVLPQPLLDALATRTVANPEGEWIPLDANIALDEAERLYAAVRELRPEHIIELGMAHGISSMAMAQALHDNGVGTLHVIDPFQQGFGSVGIANIERCGLSGCVDFSERFPEEIVPALPMASFAFIDASHLFDFTMMDFMLVDKRLDVGGVVGFHDLWMPSLQKVVRYISTNRDEYRLWRAPPASARTARRVRVGRLLGAVPGAAKVLRPELLTPTRLYARENMVLLEKTGPDARTWTDHRVF